MFAPSRDEARRFLVEAWIKHRNSEPMTALEQQAAEIIGRHPEYHAVIEQPERYADRDYPPEAGAINPFLHLSLHLAVAEQLSIDQPTGIRLHFDRLIAARGDEQCERERRAERATPLGCHQLHSSPRRTVSGSDDPTLHPDRDGRRTRGTVRIAPEAAAGQL